jgi:hypothetical protein
MTAPVLAVGDGALGFWKAIRDVFPPPRPAGALSMRLTWSLVERPDESGADQEAAWPGRP